MAENVRDLMVKVAHEVLVLDLPQGVVAKRNGIGAAYVAQLIQRAKLSGVAQTTVDPSFAITGHLNNNLTYRLGNAFSLKDSWALELTGSDDDLHIALANFVGTRVRSCIHPNEHLAVAGGRAIVRLAMVIARNCEPKKGITVSPLGGRLWNGRLWEYAGSQSAHYHDHNRRTNQLVQPLNADYSALILADGVHGGYADGVKFSQISHPLYLADAGLVNTVMEVNCPFLPNGRWNWNLKSPDRAFVGVGCIEPQSGHRLLQTIRARRDTAQFDFPSDKLQAVWKLRQQLRLPYFGDVANRLFAALPLPSQLQQTNLSALHKKYSKLNEALKEINSLALVMRWEHLMDIDSVLAIAGGQYKIGVLWTLLVARMHGLRIIDQLATDSDTAERLLSEFERYERAHPSVREWYGSTVQMILSS